MVAVKRLEPGWRDLREIVRDAFDLEIDPIDLRIRSLVARFDSRDPQLPRFIVDEIEKPAIEAEWRNALLFLLERVDVRDDELRERLARRLIDLARDAMIADEVETLSSALRRHASLATPSDMLRVTAFLEKDGTPESIQAALQSLQSFFSKVAPSTMDASTLRLLVEKLLLTFKGRQDTPERSVLLNAILAAATLEMEIAVSYCSNDDRPFTRILRAHLHRMLDERRDSRIMAECLQALTS